MRAIRAEWTKLRSTPGVVWLLVVTAIATVALGAAVSAACPQAGCGAGVVLSGVYVGQAPVAVLGVLAVSGEYSSALIRTTLAAIPNRATVMAAKALVVAVVVAAVASLALLVSVVVAGPLLPGVQVAGRAVVRAVVYLVLIALLSVGAAAVVRDSAVAIGSVLGLLYLPPILAPLVANPRLVEQLAPMTAGLPVVTAWSAAMLAAGTLLLRLRDT